MLNSSLFLKTCLALFILLQAVLLYLFAFDEWQGPGDFGGNRNYVPAVMIAAGRGFCDVDIETLESTPDLKAFINFEVSRLDASTLPEDLKTEEPNEWHRIYTYLLYTVGFLWRLFGISWNVTRAFSIFLLLIACLLVYGLSRLAMPVYLSLLVAHAFAWNSAVLWTLRTLRDFSKAPFILGVMLLLGVAVKKPPSAGRFLRVAVLTGVVLGFGMGFRRDMLALLPLAILVLITCRLRPMRHPHLLRATAAFLTAFSFLLCSLPILLAFYPIRWTNAHDIVMGFSTRSDQELGVLEPASYEKHHLQHDGYTTWKIWEGVRHGFSVSQETLDGMTFKDENSRTAFVIQSYILAVARIFPADMLARAYGAVLRSIAGVQEPVFFPLALFHRMGFLFVISGLLIMALSSPYLASQTLLLLCFFCGYISLQYGARHAFHTAFIPYWFGCFTIYHVYSACMSGKRFALTQDALPANVAAIKRAFLWFVAACLTFYVPMKIAQHIQHNQVTGVVAAYENAKRTPIPHTTINHWEGMTLIAPANMEPCRLCDDLPPFPYFTTRLLVARFKALPINPNFNLIYEWDHPGWAYSAPVVIHTRPGMDAGGVTYYFAVYKSRHCGEWNRFAGILMPEEQSRFFEGYYKVESFENLGFIFNVAVPDNPDAFVAMQRVRLPWPHRPPDTYHWPDALYLRWDDAAIRRLMQVGEFERAAAEITSVLQLRPGSIHYQALLVQGLLLNANKEAAWSVIDDMISQYPEDGDLYARLDAALNAYDNVAGRYHEWKRIVAINPGDVCAKTYFDHARRQFEAQNEVSTAIE